MGETQSLPWEPQSDLKAQSLPWGAPRAKGENSAFPKRTIPWEENKRQVVLIGADIRGPRPERGGRNVEASMAPCVQLRGRGLRTSAC